MEYTDTISLLKQCDAGSKMAVNSIDTILEKVERTKLLPLLLESKKSHKQLGAKIHLHLKHLQSEEKDPSFIAKSMANIKTNVEMFMDSSDQKIAELLFLGCDMGIKSLYQYLNEYKEADDFSKAMCKELIQIEESLKNELVAYL